MKKGFTLLELLLIAAIIAILATVIISVTKPGRQVAQARDLQRKTDISEINKAINQYYIDHGNYPPTLTYTPTDICDSASNPKPTCLPNQVNLGLLVPTYLVTIPKDPGATASSSGYSVAIESKSRSVFTVAPLTELGANGSTTVLYVGRVPSGYTLPTASGAAADTGDWWNLAKYLKR